MANVGYWDDPSWDSIKLGSVVMPGIWEVSGSVERKIDVKGTKKADGATITDHGYQPGTFSLQGRVGSKEGWDAMKTALDAVHPRRGGKERQPLDIVHPGLNALGVHKVYVTAIDVPRLHAQVMEIEIKVIEWQPAPKKIVQKAKSAAVPNRGYGDPDARPSIAASAFLNQTVPTTDPALQIEERQPEFWEKYAEGSKVQPGNGVVDAGTTPANEIAATPRVPGVRGPLW